MTILYDFGTRGNFEPLWRAQTWAFQTWAFQRLISFNCAGGDLRWGSLRWPYVHSPCCGSSGKDNLSYWFETSRAAFGQGPVSRLILPMLTVWW
ncbi:MAG: hypothetical protein V7606_4965, partial [Burkholderiales bacterium]